jgi:hypothetical protein
VDWKTAATLAVTVAIAVAGYIYSLHLTRRKDRFERVDRQLSEFYGPLLALVSAGDRSWLVFRKWYRPGGGPFWDPKNPPTTVEADAWRLWMKEVFMPLNEQIVDVITGHANLLNENAMPECLLELCAHVAAYRPVLTSWEHGDFSNNTAPIPFPTPALHTYAAAAFTQLKTKQNKLLGQDRRIHKIIRDRLGTE